MKKIFFILLVLSSNAFAQGDEVRARIQDNQKLTEIGRYTIENIKSKIADETNKTYNVSFDVYTNTKFNQPGNVKTWLCSFKNDIILNKGAVAFDCGEHEASAYLTNRGNDVYIIVNQFNDHGESTHQDISYVNTIKNSENSNSSVQWSRILSGYVNPKYNGTWDN